jgi:hypothetical protein
MMWLCSTEAEVITPTDYRWRVSETNAGRANKEGRGRGHNESVCKGNVS